MNEFDTDEIHTRFWIFQLKIVSKSSSGLFAMEDLVDPVYSKVDLIIRQL